MPFYPRVLKSFRLLMRSTLACPAWVLKYKIQNTWIEVVSITYEKYSEARLGRSNTKCKICVLKLFGLLTKSTLRPSLGEDIYIYKLQSTEYCIPHICHGRHSRRPCKFLLAGVNFYRFNAKNWRCFTDFTRKICVFFYRFNAKNWRFSV